MKLRRIIAGMAAAAMALAMTVVANAADVNEVAICQVYFQETAGWKWVGSGESDASSVKIGETTTVVWEPTGEALDVIKGVAEDANNQAHFGVQFLNGAIQNQEGTSGSLKGSAYNIEITAGDGVLKLDYTDDLTAENLEPQDMGDYFSGQSKDTNWYDPICKAKGFTTIAEYNAWVSTVTKVSVTFKLDNMTYKLADGTEGPAAGGNDTPPAGDDDQGNNDTPATGAAAGAALALVAVAGAALVVSKKKN